MIDQTQLPARLVTLRLVSVDMVREAIRSLRVRGAPAIGVAAALGVLLVLNGRRRDSTTALVRRVRQAASRLESARPTAVNLAWALRRMVSCAEKSKELAPAIFRKSLEREALLIRDEDRRLCREISRHGAGLLRSGDSVLTHCNAGALATAGMGTALGVVYEAARSGKKLSVYVGETRPLLQGARLSAWELMRRKIGVTLITDSMVASVMRQGRVDKVVVGADRIAANGDTANKIGTYSIACLARLHKIPFYVAAPSSTFDFSIPDGRHIPIEERAPQEITAPFGRPTAPKGVKVFNPAFDVTPAGLITAIITERGIARPPFKTSLRHLLGRRRDERGGTKGVGSGTLDVGRRTNEVRRTRHEARSTNVLP